MSGLSLIFEVGGDLQKIAGVRVAAVKSTCWFYIKVAGDRPQNMRGKSRPLMTALHVYGGQRGEQIIHVDIRELTRKPTGSFSFLACPLLLLYIINYKLQTY